MNECPLGAAALAGSPFPIDRHQTAAARLRELETGGYVWTSGQRATRSGRMAQVYLVTSKGATALRTGD